ncbi:hypothetical protein Lal_00011196 [Lupinus albus]|nr:hypothetical protein Lal_00011196 [Lupinus albus]
MERARPKFKAIVSKMLGIEASLQRFCFLTSSHMRLELYLWRYNSLKPTDEENDIFNGVRFKPLYEKEAGSPNKKQIGGEGEKRMQYVTPRILVFKIIVTVLEASLERELSRLGEKWQFWAVDTV